jgi:hypothetical protein
MKDAIDVNLFFENFLKNMMRKAHKEFHVEIVGFSDFVAQKIIKNMAGFNLSLEKKMSRIHILIYSSCRAIHPLFTKRF